MAKIKNWTLWCPSFATSNESLDVTFLAGKDLLRLSEGAHLTKECHRGMPMEVS